MNNNFDYSTYLFLSKKKFILSVYEDNSTKNVYEKQLNIENQLEDINYGKLEKFLNENIFKIEKILNNFVKKIILIVDIDQFFLVELSIKKKDDEHSINLKSLNHLLYEAKENCRKTIVKKQIIHLIIKNYKIENEDYKFLPKDVENKSFSVDLKFICLSNEIIKNFEDILNKYQISLGQIVNADYIKEFLTNEENQNIFLMTKKILTGHNPNEVNLVDKSLKNQGFFEKFFNIFN